MTGEEIKVLLMNACVSAIGKLGLENASIRSIGNEVDLEASLVYRYFRDKDDLLARTYVREQEKLVSVIASRIGKVKTESDLKNMWDALMGYLLGDELACRFCRYYYNSPTFTRFNFADHKKQLDAMWGSLQCHSKNPELMELFIYHFFDTAFSTSMRIFNEGKSKKDAKKICDDTYNLVFAQQIKLFQ